MIKVLLADDHSYLRKALRSFLGEQPDIDVVGEARNGREAIRFCKEFAVDLVLMDLNMPEINGIEATRSIVSEFPHTIVIVLSMHPEKAYISAALEAGAKGYIVKDNAAAELVDAIRSIVGRC